MNLLPQLPSIKAKVILEDIASKSNCETLDPKGNFKVEGIFYVPTGGQIINDENLEKLRNNVLDCLLYTSPSPRDPVSSRMPSSA